MVENPALLQAVVASPDVDRPRIAYAEWCETVDEEDMRRRAELIRTQIELVYASPELLNSGGAYARQSRVAELIQQWGPTWKAPLQPYIVAGTFQRGFVGLVKMTASEFLRSAETVFTLAPVRHLDLTEVRKVDVETLFATPAFSKIVSLSLDDCDLGTRDIAALAASPRLMGLRWLSLQNNHLDLASARALAAGRFLTGLRVVRFSGNPVDPTEELGVESGEVVSTWLPEAGEELEREFGRIGWLHWRPDNSRFE